jgi:hypothetical protein
LNCGRAGSAHRACKNIGAIVRSELSGVIDVTGNKQFAVVGGLQDAAVSENNPPVEVASKTPALVNAFALSTSGLLPFASITPLFSFTRNASLI